MVFISLIDVQLSKEMPKSHFGEHINSLPLEPMQLFYMAFYEIYIWYLLYESGHGTVAVLSPGFAINW